MLELDLDSLLISWQQGDQKAFEQLFPMVYDKLKAIASRILKKSPHQPLLQTTALVNEAFCRLQKLKKVSLENRNHFFALAAKVARSVVVDYVRNESPKDNHRIKITLNETILTQLTHSPDNVELLALDRALDKLATLNPRGCKIVEMHFFGGMTFEEIASFLDCSISTVKGDWSFVRAWLLRELKS
jgi:RNA polymerase sigma factor (TIGR02999 family)